MDKVKQRSSMLKKRKNHSFSQQKKKSIQIVNQLKENPIYNKANEIALYHAVHGEADPEALRFDDNKNFYLPILSNKDNAGLAFAPATKDSTYKNNQFAIPEPLCEAESYISTKELDIVLMPLLGFDLQGSRLGMGGGYYDRCFSFKKDKKNTIIKPLLIGYAFDFQEIKNIEIEPWDIALDAIVTESRFILF